MGLAANGAQPVYTPTNPAEIITAGRPDYYRWDAFQQWRHDEIRHVRQYRVTNQYGLLNGWQIYSSGSQVPSSLKYIPGILFPNSSLSHFRSNRQWYLPRPGSARGVTLAGPASAALIQTTRYPTPPTLTAYLMGRVRTNP